MDNDDTYLTISYTEITTRCAVFAGEELEIIKSFLEQDPDMNMDEAIFHLVELGKIRNPYECYDELTEDLYPNRTVMLCNDAEGLEMELDDDVTASTVLGILNQD